jgi:membrane associated rhomboid family serine protease/outer membrane protein assembly factor BamD (BamD/ComL family)
VIIIPVGLAATIRRVPIVTVTIIGLCAAIWIGTEPIVRRQEAQIVRVAAELQGLEEPLKQQYYLATSDRESYAEFFGNPKRLQELRSRIKSGEGWPARGQSGERVVIGDATRTRLVDLYDRLEELERTRLFARFGFVPGRYLDASVVTSLFLHGGFLHLLWNMWFLLLVGFALEDLWGRVAFPIFYGLSGVAASLLHGSMYPDSVIPVIGASGATAGVMGAFMVRHFTTKIRYFYLFFWPLYGTFELPAYVALGAWFSTQLAWGLASLEAPGGVAFWAHIGGFLFGAAVGLVVRATGIEREVLAPSLEAKLEYAVHPAIREAMDLVEGGQFERGEQRLRGLLAREPGHAEANVALGRLYLERRLYPEALPLYERAIATHLARREEEVALGLYQELLDGHPRAVLGERILFQVASAEARRGDADKAVDDFERFATHYPANALAPKALFQLADLVADALKNPTQAVALYERLLRDYPDLPWKSTVQTRLTLVRSRVQTG